MDSTFIILRDGANLPGVKAAAWDFDGVFYRPSDFLDGSFNQLASAVHAVVACFLISGLDLDSAQKLANDSYNKYGDSLVGYLDFFGTNEKRHAFRSRHFALYHKFLLEKITDKDPQFFAPAQDLIAAFQMPPPLKHGILTHGHIDEWTDPISRSMGIRRFFNDQAMCGFADFNFVNKSESGFPLRFAMDRLKSVPQETAFIEDTLRNLERAKMEYPDLTTVWIVAQEPKDVPDYVDVVASSPVPFLQKLAQAKLG